MVLFGSDKSRLYIIKDDIEKYLNTNLGLQLKDNWQIYKFKLNNQINGRDLDFLGFRFYGYKTILRKSILRKMKRKALHLCHNIVDTIQDCRQMLSYIGWLKYTDTYGMYKHYIKPYVSFRTIKNYVSIWTKNRSVIYAR